MMTNNPPGLACLLMGHKPPDDGRSKVTGAAGTYVLRITLLIMASCIVLTGCASTGFLSSLNASKQFTKATAACPAVRCLCVWQTAEGFDDEGKPCRGVAGQVFFFTRDNDNPVVVEGDTKVFLFDDQGTREEQGKPIHQLDIPSEQWKTLLTATQFGPAYRLFVPYTRKGRHHAELAVRVRLTPAQGPVVFSDIASIDLPGYDLSKVTDAETSPVTGNRTDFGLLTEPDVTEKVQRALVNTLGSPDPSASPAHDAARANKSENRSNDSADQVKTIGKIITETDGQRLLQSPTI